jgi:hypothetical protein
MLSQRSKICGFGIVARKQAVRKQILQDGKLEALVML